MTAETPEPNRLTDAETAAIHESLGWDWDEGATVTITTPPVGGDYPTKVRFTDHTTPDVVAAALPHPIERAVTIARLRALADLIESTGARP